MRNYVYLPLLACSRELLRAFSLALIQPNDPSSYPNLRDAFFAYALCYSEISQSLPLTEDPAEPTNPEDHADGS